MRDPWAIPEKKDRRSLKILGSAILMIAIFAGSVLAFHWIYSNIISVTVGAYTFNGSLMVDDSTPDQYQNITFSGTLYYDGSPVASGYNVTLFKDGIDVAWEYTDSSGNFAIVYNVTETGNFDFKVGYLAS